MARKSAVQRGAESGDHPPGETPVVQLTNVVISSGTVGRGKNARPVEFRRAYCRQEPRPTAAARAPAFSHVIGAA